MSSQQGYIKGFLYIVGAFRASEIVLIQCNYQMRGMMPHGMSAMNTDINIHRPIKCTIVEPQDKARTL